MKTRTALLLSSVALMAALAIWFYARSGDVRDATPRASEHEPGSVRSPAADPDAVAKQTDPGAGPRQPDRPASHVLRGRLTDKAARERLERAIEVARTQREAAGAAPPDSAAPSDSAPLATQATTFDKRYIQDVMREARPLLAECYELARDTTPELQGKLTLEFRIAGEPAVGGLVEEVRAVDDTELSRHPVLSECVQETILSLEFIPPEDGGTIVVSYPFVFRNHDEQ